MSSSVFKELKNYFYLLMNAIEKNQFTKLTN